MAEESMQIAVLGTGIMGFPMAARLADGGWPVTVWNRTRAKAEPLGERGATVADSAAAAVEGADVVITMLLDADAVETAMSDAVGSLGEQTVWAQMSTVGEPGCRRLQRLADEHDVTFVDAPVLGTRKPAEEGKLRILASGPDDALKRCRPVFEVLGEVIEGIGPAGNGSRLKLAVNTWLLAITDATAAALALAREFGMDGELFLRAIDGTASDSPYAQLKGRAMLAGDYTPSFTAAGAAKDAHLVRDAAESLRLDTRLIDAIAAHFDAAVEAGHGGGDMAAVYAVTSPSSASD